MLELRLRDGFGDFGPSWGAWWRRTSTSLLRLWNACFDQRLLLSLLLLLLLKFSALRPALSPFLSSKRRRKNHYIWLRKSVPIKYVLIWYETRNNQVAKCNNSHCKLDLNQIPTYDPIRSSYYPQRCNLKSIYIQVYGLFYQLIPISSKKL